MTFDLGAVSLSPMWSVEFTLNFFFRKKKNKYGNPENPWILIDTADLLLPSMPTSGPPVKSEASDKTFHVSPFEFECAVT